MLNTADVRNRVWVVILGILLLGALSSPMFYAHFKQVRLKRLYYQAAGIPPYFTNSEDSVRAVHEIGSIGGDESKRLLIRIATEDSPLPNLSVQVAAIQELSRTDQADSAEIIASLVTVDNPLDLRKASAEALQTLPCDRKCLTELLNYLKMIDDRQLNNEDRSARLFEGTTSAAVKERTSAEQQEMYDLLYQRLLLQPNATNDILEQTYDLGTANPQPFSMHFAIESKDREACTLLSRSKLAIAENPASAKTTRDEVNSAVKTLSCE